jgi:hypothetical protein
MEILNGAIGWPAKNISLRERLCIFPDRDRYLIRLVIVRKLVGTGTKKEQVWYRRQNAFWGGIGGDSRQRRGGFVSTALRSDKLISRWRDICGEVT